MRSNTQRRSIVRAARALEHYTETGVLENVVELLTDVRHLCAFWGVSFTTGINASEQAFEQEESDARVTTHVE